MAEDDYDGPDGGENDTDHVPYNPPPDPVIREREPWDGQPREDPPPKTPAEGV